MMSPKNQYAIAIIGILFGAVVLAVGLYFKSENWGAAGVGIVILCWLWSIGQKRIIKRNQQ